MPQSQWPKNDEQFEGAIKKYWSDVYGDRRQEIVFIGIDMDEMALRKRLDTCLVKNYIRNKDNAKCLPDPFPIWRLEKAEA